MCQKMNVHTITKEEIEDLKNHLRDYSPRFKDFDVDVKSDEVYNILDKELYLIEDYKKIEDFYYVWTYLLKEEYIVVDGLNIKQDYHQYFFKKNIKTLVKTDRQKVLLEQLTSLGPIDLSVFKMHNPMDDRYGYKSKDIEYMDFIVDFNYQEYTRYSVIFNKIIITLPSLKWFVERRFVDVQEYTFKKSLRTTYIVLGITILLSSVSLYFSVVSSKSSTKFWKQNEQSEAITQEYVNTLLEKIVESNGEQYKLISNINDLMKDDDKHEYDFRVSLLNFLDENEEKKQRDC